MSSLRCLVLFLLFIHSETFTVSTDQSTAAEIGKDVTLKCVFDSVADSNPTVIWVKEGVNGTVYTYKGNEHDLSKQHVNYTGRTELHGSSINKGDASLTLNNVNIWDEGVYKCRVSASNGFGEASMNLFVWAKGIDGIHITWKSDDVLSCHSSKWYPAPMIAWRDTAGNNLNKDCKTTLTADNNGFFNVSCDLKQYDLTNQYICSIKHKWMAEPERIRVAFSDGGNLLRFDEKKNHQIYKSKAVLPLEPSDSFVD